MLRLLNSTNEAFSVSRGSVLKCPAEAWAEEKAMACHANGALYRALVGSVEHPTCFLEVKNDFVGASFTAYTDRSTARDYG
jgi:hypothetical protein